MENLIGDQTTDGVDGGDLALAVGQRSLLSRDVPNDLVDRVVLHLVKDAIRADKYVID